MFSELFSAVKVLHSICQQIWKTQQWPQNQKRSVFVPFPKIGSSKVMLKLPHNCTHLTCQQSNAQNSEARLQQYMNHELPDVQAGFRKGRGTRDQIANICWIIKKTRDLQKNIYFRLIDDEKPLTVQITTHCGKFLKRWKYQTTLPAS